MSIMKMDMKVQNELRPCMVRTGVGVNPSSPFMPALFHKWIEDGRVYPNSQTHALVEMSNGTIEKIRPRNIRFLDSEAKFAEFDFEGGE